MLASFYKHSCLFLQKMLLVPVSYFQFPNRHKCICIFIYISLFWAKAASCYSQKLVLNLPKLARTGSILANKAQYCPTNIRPPKLMTQRLFSSSLSHPGVITFYRIGGWRCFLGHLDRMIVSHHFGLMDRYRCKYKHRYNRRGICVVLFFDIVWA